MKQLDKSQIVGWIAVGLSTVIACFWVFWGIIENFHAGWYYESWLSNVGLMLVQYLSPMLIFMGCQFSPVMGPSIFGQGGPILEVTIARLLTRIRRASPTRPAPFCCVLAHPLALQAYD